MEQCKWHTRSQACCVIDHENKKTYLAGIPDSFKIEMKQQLDLISSISQDSLLKLLQYVVVEVTSATEYIGKRKGRRDK